MHGPMNDKTQCLFIVRSRIIKYYSDVYTHFQSKCLYETSLLVYQ